MVQPLLIPRAPGTAEASDRNIYVALITRGAASDGSQDTGELVLLGDLLGLITAEDLASSPATDTALYYDGTTLVFGKINLARLGSDVTGRLVPSTSQGQAGEALLVNNAGAPTFSALPDASATLSGVVELATATEFATGTDRGRVAAVRVIREFYDLRVMPTGGTTGQVIKKLSDNDYDVGWADDEEGTGGGGATNLSLGANNATSLVIVSSTGNDVTLQQATTLRAGLFGANDKDKLDTLAANRQLPPGGRDGQILAKSAADDYSVEWIDAASGGGLTQEQVQDFVGSMFSGNTETGISVVYDDAANKVNFVVATQRPLEDLQDAIAAMFTGNTGVNFAYDDAGGTITLTIPEATTSAAGLMPSADKTKLNSLDPDRQIARGGTAGQVYTKIDGDDYNAHWADAAAGGSSTPSHLTGTIASHSERVDNAEVNIAEPTGIRTWTDWGDIYSYTIPAGGAGVYLINSQINAKMQSQLGAAAWTDYESSGGGDRQIAETEIVATRGVDETVIANNVVYIRSGSQGGGQANNYFLDNSSMRDELTQTWYSPRGRG